MAKTLSRFYFLNFNRYSGSDESYFLSLFSGTPFKYTRKSNNEYIFLPNPYCSIIGSTQPGMLSSLFGGKRSQNGFLDSTKHILL